MIALYPTGGLHKELINLLLNSSRYFKESTKVLIEKRAYLGFLIHPNYVLWRGKVGNV
jgi:hypothetical protein